MATWVKVLVPTTVQRRELIRGELLNVGSSCRELVRCESIALGVPIVSDQPAERCLWVRRKRAYLWSTHTIPCIAPFRDGMGRQEVIGIRLRL